MIVENENPATVRLTGHLGEDGEGERFEVEFDRTVPDDADPDDEDAPEVEARRARVPADVGEHLADTYDGVTIHKDERESAETADSTETDDEATVEVSN